MSDVIRTDSLPDSANKADFYAIIDNARVASMGDADSDTKVEVEKNSDEDKVRITTGGTQRAVLDSNGLALESGASVNEISIDGTLADNSDDAVPTEKAVKTYVDGNILDENDMASDSATIPPSQQSVKAFVEGIPSNTDITKDENDFASDSDVHLATQQSIKAYVATQGVAAAARIKGWINLNGTGTIATSDSYNVTGITDNGVGDYTVTWDTDFADANYAVAGMNNSASKAFMQITTLAAGYSRIVLVDHDGSASDDASVVTLIAIGNQ